jgi:lipopolysaccharide/colanic/teichoic acid biosynthesis glycosyltransferase
MHASETLISKRLFDIVFAAIGLILFSPVLLAIGTLILIEDGPPVLFTQQRIGRHLRPFTLVKLRSMRNGQVTRIGQWIRKTGLDETLQFVNVLNGSMSLVGPRPMTRENLQRLQLYDATLLRYKPRPGITGMAQLYAGRGFKVTRLLERRYAAQQSMRLDAAIILLSFLVNIFGKRRIAAWLYRLRRAQRRKRSALRPGRNPHRTKPGPGPALAELEQLQKDIHSNL